MLWIMKDRTPGTGLALGKHVFGLMINIFSLVPGIQIKVHL